MSVADQRKDTLETFLLRVRVVLWQSKKKENIGILGQNFEQRAD